MDQNQLLGKIRDRNTLTLALHYAVNDRIYADWYYDYFEIDYVKSNAEKILDQLQAELSGA
jgi:hypothetical protein